MKKILMNFAKQNKKLKKAINVRIDVENEAIFFQFKDNTEIRQNLITLLIWMTKKINILKKRGTYSDAGFLYCSEDGYNL